MCGIAGWVDFHRNLRHETETARAMADTQSCRGPDDEGVWTGEHAAIVHRRLSVIDLAGGGQPMRTRRRPEGAEIVLTYAGEVYNFQELRAELRSHGHRFETRSDTEVVLHAYVQWGRACVEHFVGMFGFAIWDGDRRELLLARDRLGVKPLYYHPYRNGVLFGSEPKALLANPLFTAVLDDDGINELFAMFGSHSPGRTALRGMHEVRPGTTVLIAEGSVHEERYWSLESGAHTDDLDTTVETVRSLLDDAVTGQLVSDVPLGVLVSGGIDSSVVASLAALATEGDDAKLRTFSVDFSGSEGDFSADSNRPELDAPYVRELVGHIGAQHSDVVIRTPDLLEVQNRATVARDLPSMGDLDSSLHLLFRAIQGRTTVALSGESADEVFGGYAWFNDPKALARDGFPWAMDDLGLANVLSDGLLARLQPADYVRSRYAEAMAEVPRLQDEGDEATRLREAAHLGLTHFLPVLLDRKDRMSMAVGLEVRVPFCDHRLVQYAWNLPIELKKLNGEPKGMLRAAVADLLPESLLRRPKSMYPTAVDPDYDYAVRSRVLKLLEEPSRVGPLLDMDRVLSLVEGSSRRPPWMQRLALTYLVQIEHWLHTYDVRLP